MKKNIAMLMITFSLCFSQTGMLLDAGMGVWVNASVMNVDSDVNDWFDPGYTVGFGYMTDNGIELTLDYWVDFYGFGSDFNPMDVGAIYHMKSSDGLSWKFGLRLTDFGDSEDANNDGTHLVIGGYTDMMWFTVDHNLSYDDTWFDSPFVSGETSIAFGKMFPMDSIWLGVSYTAGTDDIDMGWVGVTIGTTF